MKSPTTTAYSILIYSGILGLTFIVLSSMALAAYGCGYDFRESSVIYMLYLIYFRSGRCYDEVNWSILDGINQEISLQPEMPTESNAVFRTLIFSVIYLTLNIFLVITCILSFCGLRKTGKSKHLVFWLYFAPFITIFGSIVIMDLTASGFYIFEYFSALGVNGLMRIMEIQNTEEMRPIIEQISISTRSLPSMIMFAATSKTVVFLILNFWVAFVFPSAVWQVCKENEEIIKTVEVREEEPVATLPKRTHDVNVIVSQTNADEEEQGQSTYDSQPPYNPYLSNPRKQSTHF